METTLKAKAETRNSSFELLRIAAMLFIVFSHSSVHGGFPDEMSSLLRNNVFLDCCVLGELGVDIFVLISGYFLCRKENTVASISKIWSQLIFYSLVFAAIYILTGNTPTLKQAITAVLPTIFNEYWFATAYIVMLFLSPCINRFISACNQKQLLSCIAVMLMLWSVIYTFSYQTMYGDTMAQFAMLYLIGAYFRLYPDNIFAKRKVRIAVCLVSFALTFASTSALRILESDISFFHDRVRHLLGGKTLFALTGVIGMFSMAVYGKEFYSKAINLIGGCTFGVYLFHENPFVRDFLWIKLTRNFEFYDLPVLPLRIIISALAVFFCGVLIELVRKKFIEKTGIKITDKIIDSLCRRTLKIRKKMAELAGIK